MAFVFIAPLTFGVVFLFMAEKIAEFLHTATAGKLNLGVMTAVLRVLGFIGLIAGLYIMNSYDLPRY